MKGGALVGLLFFLLLSIAALTSMVSLLEVPVAYAIERFGLRRRTASFYVGSALFALGIPASLGFGLLSDVITLDGRNLLDAMDFVAVDVLLPLNGLLLTIFLGWVWPRRQALEASDMHLSRLGRLWHFSIRYLLPMLVAVVLITTIVRLWLSPQ
jgi:NSS family neurotransmitter:Na+ symporter